MRNKRSYYIFSLIILYILILSPLIFAHGLDEEISQISGQQGIDWFSPVPYIIISAIWLGILTILLLTIGKGLAQTQDEIEEIEETKKPSIIEKNKKLFFMIMVTPVILSTIYLAGHTIYENTISETGGPVHWHADYQVWACGEKLDLIDPEGIKNKIGSSAFHEHNDDRIHFEGIPKKISDVSLGRYFRIIGGELEENPGHLIFPTHETTYNLEDGDSCPNGEIGTLKVYVNGNLIENFEEYVIYPDPNVPPGDCIVIIFDSSNKETTDLICESWHSQDWSYDSFVRRKVTIGDRVWE